MLIVLPVYAQTDNPVQPDATAPANTPMVIAPAVGMGAYPDHVGAEARTNFIRAGIVFQPAYVDNLYAGSGTTPISETTYSILPTLSLDQSNARQHRSFSYSPGFTFYRPTSALNEVDQNALVAYRYRLTENADISLHDDFQDSSTSMSTVTGFAGSTVTGAPQSFVPGIVAPFAKRLTNSADGEFTWQFAPNNMIGASGTEMKLHYPNPSEALGLYDSDEEGGSAFYEHRASTREYIGFAGSYARVQAYPTGATSTVETQTYYPFIAIYPRPQFNISLAGGDQRFVVSQSPLPNFTKWTPFAMISTGWQGAHASVALSAQRILTAGGGLAGAYHTSTANLFARFQLTRAWTIEGSALYADSSTATTGAYFAEPGGHSISGRGAVARSFGSQVTAGFEFDRLHQSYSGIPVIASNPNSDREMMTLAWQFSRPLGR